MRLQIVAGQGKETLFERIHTLVASDEIELVIDAERCGDLRSRHQHLADRLVADRLPVLRIRRENRALRNLRRADVRGGKAEADIALRRRCGEKRRIDRVEKCNLIFQRKTVDLPDRTLKHVGAGKRQRCRDVGVLDVHVPFGSVARGTLLQLLTDFLSPATVYLNHLLMFLSVA